MHESAGRKPSNPNDFCWSKTGADSNKPSLMNHHSPIVEVNDNTYADVINRNEVVLLYFWVEWSTACEVLDQLLERLVEEHPEITVAKLDTSEHKDTVRTFTITIVPTIILFHAGNPVDVFVEDVQYPTLERAVESYL